MSYQPIQKSVALFQVSSPIIILLKKYLSASAIVTMSWQDVTWSPLCSGVEEGETKCAHNFLFPKSSFRILGDVQRYCYHSWYDSKVISDQISNSSNVYLSLSWFQKATSLIIFYRLPSISKSRIPPKKFDQSEPHSHKPFAPIPLFLLQTDRLWNKIIWQLCSFPPSMMYKEKRCYKTSYNLYAVKDKHIKLGVYGGGLIVLI
jgi:hypothetical protein